MRVLGVVALIALIGVAMADIPVHCLTSGIMGNWTMMVTDDNYGPMPDCPVVTPDSITGGLK
ncbi:hypothetical protein KIPB_006984, partial [Kipferlia bialata]|eukprot:g6984.t1